MLSRREKEFSKYGTEGQLEMEGKLLLLSLLHFTGKLQNRTESPNEIQTETQSQQHKMEPCMVLQSFLPLFPTLT